MLVLGFTLFHFHLWTILNCGLIRSCLAGGCQLSTGRRSDHHHAAIYMSATNCPEQKLVILVNLEILIYLAILVNQMKIMILMNLTILMNLLILVYLLHDTIYMSATGYYCPKQKYKNALELTEVHISDFKMIFAPSFYGLNQLALGGNGGHSDILSPFALHIKGRVDITY